MDVPTPAPSRLLRIVTGLAVAVGTLVLDGMAVAYLWGNGVNFAIKDRVEPGGSGFQINPLLMSYRLLLAGLLAANVGLLLHLLVKRRRWYAFCFVIGAAVPMRYLLSIVFSA